MGWVYVCEKENEKEKGKGGVNWSGLESSGLNLFLGFNRSIVQSISYWTNCSVVWSSISGSHWKIHRHPTPLVFFSGRLN